jgi:hypothetical protein
VQQAKQFADDLKKKLLAVDPVVFSPYLSWLQTVRPLLKNSMPSYCWIKNWGKFWGSVFGQILEEHQEPLPNAAAQGRWGHGQDAAAVAGNTKRRPREIRELIPELPETLTACQEELHLSHPWPCCKPVRNFCLPRGI